MSLLDKNEKQATGSLSLLSNFNSLIPEGTGDSLLSEMWSARGGYPFSMKPNSEATVVFLDDIQVFAAAPFVQSWVSKGTYSFPNLDYVRCGMYDDNGQETDEPCYVSSVTGLRPRLLGIAPIVDLRPYESKKDGTVHPYTIRPLLIKDRTVLSQMEMISKQHGRSLKFARMAVTRSSDNKSASCGDSWFCTEFISEDTLDADIKDWREKLAAMDFHKGYPRPDKELAIQCLRLHVSVCKKNSEKNSPVLQYDSAMWDELQGQSSTTATSETQPSETAAPSGGILSGAAATTTPATTEFNLDDIDAVLGD